MSEFEVNENRTSIETSPDSDSDREISDDDWVEAIAHLQANITKTTENDLDPSNLFNMIKVLKKRIEDLEHNQVILSRFFHKHVK